MVLRTGFILFAPVVLMLGCEREKIHVYTAPKDQIPTVAASDNPHGMSGDNPHAAMGELPRPQITWTLPPDWKEASPDSAVTLAAFTLPGGKTAKAAMSPLRDWPIFPATKCCS